MNNLAISADSKQSKGMRREWFIGLALVIVTLIAFRPVGHFGFILYDDHDYVVENTHVQNGITLESIHWAFTTMHAGNWHPVTWLSHMLDCQWFGLNAGAHHWVNLAFHVANSLLLFLLLVWLTATLWRSALVAALFALHPTHVQSVAWISERKDVLSAFFFLLTLLGYVAYVKQSKVPGLKSKVFFSLALFGFALGLMSKPMLVTVPVILLLLDFWPLKRVSSDGWRVTKADLSAPRLSALYRLLLEKLPFIALSAASSIITFWAQNEAKYVMPMSSLSGSGRIFNALVFYAIYLGKMFWPENLAMFYPYTGIESWEMVGAGLLLIGISVFFIRQASLRPYLLIGWFWFLVMLLPVIGLVQVGTQIIADRYTYLPSIGLFIMVAWLITDVARISRFWWMGMTVISVVLVLTCLVETRIQLRYWQNEVALFSHTIGATGEDNVMGQFLLGNAFLESDNLEGASRSYQSALRFYPDFENGHCQLGYVLLLQKKWREAEDQLRETLRLNPNNIYAHTCLGDALAGQEKFAEAQIEYETALQAKPDDTALRQSLARITQQAEIQNSLARLYAALKTQPTPEVHLQIAAFQAKQGKFQEAVDHCREALSLKPDSPEVLNDLAWFLATCPNAHVRDGNQAVKYAERACELTQYTVTPLVGTLGAAYAEAGQFDRAIATAERACALAEKSGQTNLLQKNQELLIQYRSHRPFHGDAEKSSPAMP